MSRKLPVFFILFLFAVTILSILTFNSLSIRTSYIPSHASTTQYVANIEGDNDQYGVYNPKGLADPNIDAKNIGMYWGSVEPQEGVFNWAPADKEVADWVAKGKKYILTIPFVDTDGNGSADCSTTWTPVLPQWEVAKIQSFCDTDRGLTIPDYFNKTFMTDATAYVNAVAAHFNASPYKSSLVYVRAGVGLGSDAFLLPSCRGSDCDYEEDVNTLVSYGYSPTAYIQWEEHMLLAYKAAFPYTTVIAPISAPLDGNTYDINPQTGNPLQFDMAKWAAANGLGIGQEALIDTPDYTNTLPSDVISYIKTNYPQTYIQLKALYPVSSNSTYKCPYSCVFHGDINNAEAAYAKSIEWSMVDVNFSSYDPFFVNWEQIVSAQFSNITSTPVSTASPTMPASPVTVTVASHMKPTMISTRNTNITTGQQDQSAIQKVTGTTSIQVPSDSLSPSLLPSSGETAYGSESSVSTVQNSQHDNTNVVIALISLFMLVLLSITSIVFRKRIAGTILKIKSRIVKV